MNLERRSGDRSTGRHEAFDLFTDEEVVRVRVAVEKFEAAVDAVVIGQRHDIHAPRLRRTIDRLGL